MACFTLLCTGSIRWLKGLCYKRRMKTVRILALLPWLLSCSAAVTPDTRDVASTADLAAPAGPADGAAGPSDSSCAGTHLLSRPADPAQSGPWPVGARTVTIGRLTVEVFYPAKPQSEQGTPAVVYDLREHMPKSERGKISDAKNPWQQCSCHRDLPVDEGHGPYPVLVFIHGTAGFRTQSLSQLTHLASRGFVVLAADHPGLMLADILAAVCPGTKAGMRDLSGDVMAMLAELRRGGALAFMSGHADPTRIGLVGHSAGGAAVAELGDQLSVQAVVSWAAGTPVHKGPDLRASLFVGGKSDKVVKFSSVQAGYLSSGAPKQLVGVDGAGHLMVTELCSLHNPDGENILTVAKDAGICGAGLAGLLFDCSAPLPDARGTLIVEHATTTMLEGILTCGVATPTGLTGLLGLRGRFTEVSVLDEQF